MLTLKAPLLSSTILLAAYLVRKLRKNAIMRLPPGPKGWPIVGNISDIPHEKSWLTYMEWKRIYGDIVYVEPLGSPIIILNSLEDIRELLDRRSAITADRPRMVMANELTGWGWDFAHMRYGDYWRKHRKVFHQYFQQKNVPLHFPVIRNAAINLLNQLHRSPDKFRNHIRHGEQYPSSPHGFAGAIILKLTYDYNVATEDDYYVALADKAIEGLLPVVHVGSNLVDMIPILKYIPTWFPGADFKVKASIGAQYAKNLRDIPFEEAKKRMVSGSSGTCFVSNNLGKNEIEEGIVRNAAGIAYLAGSDTTVSVLISFILAMLHYPDVQARAYEEIESLTDGLRVPNFDDRPSLPYIEALLLELLRWAPPTPLAVPHRLLQTDVYKGYTLPSGAVLVPNVYGVFHDEEQFPEPFKFKPERFLDGDVDFDPISMGAFGYGRRICPGRYVTLNSSWLAIVQILTMFTIVPKRDENGKAKKLEPPNYSTGLVVHPTPFEADIIPRSEKALELLMKMDMED